MPAGLSLPKHDQASARHITHRATVAPLFSGRPDYRDVGQGALGDCWLMAALAASAAADPRLIETLVRVLPDGRYRVLLDTGHVSLHTPMRWFGLGARQQHHELERRSLLCRSRQPLDANQAVDRHLWFSCGAQMYARSHGLRDCPVAWPALIEKAYAQHFDGYGNLDGAEAPAVALTRITGRRTTRVELSSTAPAKLLRELQALTARKRPVVLTSSRGRRKRLAKRFPTALAIPQRHAFAFVGLGSPGPDGFPIIQLYNPWGESGPFRGAFSLSLTVALVTFSHASFVDATQPRPSNRRIWVDARPDSYAMGQLGSL